MLRVPSGDTLQPPRSPKSPGLVHRTPLFSQNVPNQRPGWKLEEAPCAVKRPAALPHEPGRRSSHCSKRSSGSAGVPPFSSPRSRNSHTGPSQSPRNSAAGGGLPTQHSAGTVNSSGTAGGAIPQCSQGPRRETPQTMDSGLASLCCPAEGCWKILASLGLNFGRQAAVEHAPSTPVEDDRVWYRIWPEADSMTWYVRREAGPPEWHRRHTVEDGDIQIIQTPMEEEEGDEKHVPPRPTLNAPMHQKQNQYHGSIPDFVERFIGTKDPDGFERDAMNEDCRICFERRAEVILLPCRHGCLCEECMRMAVYTRPEHRGGRQCPFCRKRIREVVKLYRGEGVVQFGYAIKAGHCD
eukprot:TRINITY_DN21277_c0_g1_i1.p1 TRINITY_DN21277_c0_g1~~TRINITY_DN21277_c0_g1_i1.p1  ORF type:complete len:353 (+),score=56.05 TRINITY_DN21277_c0_g1_i1:221-1279(+)